MSISVYLDHNIIDDISKGELCLKPSSDSVIWLYSDTNLQEVKRSDNKRFLDVLEDIEARKLELILDGNFRITGNARILEYRSPHDVYENYLDATSRYELVNGVVLEFLARLYGANNKDKVLSCPELFEESVRSLLDPYGLHGEEIEIELERVRGNLVEFVNGPMQEVGKLVEARNWFGTGDGMASNLAARENPIEELWSIVKNRVPSEVTADQFFGFDPLDKQGYDAWPMYLGIVGCCAMLNTLGFRPDDGLTRLGGISRMLSDASHIGLAAYCNALFSRDKKLLAKAKAIYRYKNIPTQVVSYERNR